MSTQSTPAWEVLSSLRGRWIVWSVCVVIWTIGLLTPYPVRVSNAIISRGATLSTAGTAFSAAKALHVLAYAVLMMATVWLHARTSTRWCIVGFLAGHACLTEYFQNYVSTRTGSVRDVLLDALGITIGLAVCWKYAQRRPM